ncbi:MAG: hypothetical protein IPL76_07030 [Gemmatimonadetes bacterium]|nr:hypothetical protein [Gemmatimonadota bacterium]
MIWAGLLRDSVQVAYDSAFRVKTQTVHGTSTVSFSYDRDGLLVAAGALRLGRSGTHGLLLADTLGPVRGSYSYTSRGELAGLHQARSGTTLLGTGYLRDSLGRITQLTDSAREAGGTPQVRRWSYVYDGVSRLLRDSLDGALHQAFAYDSNGNRTSLTTALGTVSSSYDAQDRLTRSATSGGVVTLYAYGSNGELQTKTDSATGAQTRYQYDALGNLLKVVLPTGDSVEYLIDGQNRRVGRKLNGVVTHRWLYQNQLNPIAELDSAGALVSRFVYGSRANVPDYLVRGGAVYRLVTDHLGSVRAVVDTATGAVAQWTTYDAWGNVLADSGAGSQPFGFAGGMADSATGLVRFGARDYDPAVGRWTAKDPVGFSGGESGTYVYSANDPVDLQDPSGAVVPIVLVGMVAAFIAIDIAWQQFRNGYQLACLNLGRLPLLGRWASGPGTWRQLQRRRLQRPCPLEPLVVHNYPASIGPMQATCSVTRAGTSIQRPCPQCSGMPVSSSASQAIPRTPIPVSLQPLRFAPVSKDSVRHFAAGKFGSRLVQAE